MGNLNETLSLYQYSSWSDQWPNKSDDIMEWRP
jgi:hypothetical protein